MPLIRDYIQATALLPTDAFPFDRIGVGTMYAEAHIFPAGQVSVAFEFLGATPTGSQIIGLCAFDYAVTFPAGFGSPQSYGVPPGTNATSTFSANMYKNGVLCGTMTISPAGVYAFSTVGNLAVTFSAGDTLKITGPSVADATLADFAWTLAAQAN